VVNSKSVFLLLSLFLELELMLKTAVLQRIAYVLGGLVLLFLGMGIPLFLVMREIQELSAFDFLQAMFHSLLLGFNFLLERLLAHELLILDTQFASLELGLGLKRREFGSFEGGAVFADCAEEVSVLDANGVQRYAIYFHD
jgi:hypothetical protein